jgi:DNA-binding NtrC family response regulator
MKTTRSQATGEAEGANTSGSAPAREPGLLLVFSGGEPCCVPIPLGADPIELGRGHGALASARDAMISRRHALAAHREGRFRITDRGSRNGSALDGEPLQGEVATDAARVLRLGNSLFLLCPDLGPARQLGVRTQGARVEGPSLQRTILSVAKAAPLSRTLFISGESGAGKEWIARVFHQAGPGRDGPFVAVNCATIAEGIAERLLFGAVKGAYSGAAADSEGYVQAAHGGTLFLDEIGDLDAGVQAKLLRFLESGEAAQLGATRPRKVDVRICCATCKDLRGLVSAGKFRADLYFRVGVPEVSLSPLRERREEIPWLVVGAVRAAEKDLQVHASLIEACLLRAWPGNVRELLAEASTAVIAALAAGSAAVSAQHLRPGAGAAILSASAEVPEPVAARRSDELTGAAPAPPKAEALSRQDVIAALIRASCNVSAAARALDLHRNQLRRLLARYDIDVDRLRGAAGR